MSASETASRKVAAWRTKATRSRSEFVIVPLRFVDKTKSAMMSCGQEVWSDQVVTYLIWVDPNSPSPKA